MPPTPVLCTYSATGKNFVQQHWYNCFTCNMIDGEGVCSVCAVNCHKDHDLSYRLMRSEIFFISIIFFSYFLNKSVVGTDFFFSHT